MSDGASACLLTTRAQAKKLGLKVEGVFRGFAVAGVPPAVMGIGPAFAIPLALERAGVYMYMCMCMRGCEYECKFVCEYV